MSETLAYIISLLIILTISFCIGFFLSKFWFIGLPVCFLLGAYGVDAISKQLQKK